MNKLVAIIGPTGIGKSRLALHLAQILNAEIVSADSRKVYRYMDIGTAKPGNRELSLIPHHIINILNPDESFSLAQYKEMAGKAVDDIWQRQKLPLLVGGSGQYVWSVLEGWGIPGVPPSPDFRRSLEERAARGEGEELYRELERRSPTAASRIDRHNIRRVIRALEISQDSKSIPEWKPSKKPSFSSLIIGLTVERDELYRRIDKRVDRMVEQGLIEEVKTLVSRGYRLDLPAMSGIGYRQIGEYLEGKTTKEAAIQQIKFESHRFVRQQYNWFRLKDDRIEWFDIQCDSVQAITNCADRFISRAGD